MQLSAAEEEDVWWTLDPNAPEHYAWQLWVVLLVIYTMVEAPIAVGFGADPRETRPSRPEVFPILEETSSK